MSDPIPITMAELPQLVMELSQAGSREACVEEVDGVRYITASSHPGKRWFVVDAASEPTPKGLPGPGVPHMSDPHGSSEVLVRLIVEIHFPMIPTPGLPEDEFQFPWIMEFQDRLAALTLESDGAEDYDDGEQLGDTYAFFLTGEDKAAVLSAAKKIATGPNLPAGAFVIVNHAGGDMGEGERVELSAIP